MLNSLKPPTDNLYKFMSIAGLVCFIVAVILAAQQTGKTIDVSLAAEAVLQEAWLSVDAELDGEDKDEAFDLINAAWEKAMGSEAIFGLTQNARELGTLTQDELTAIRRFEIAADAMVDQQQLQNALLNLLSGLLAGAFLVMVAGFILWYRKTQRYQDKLLKMQTEEQTPVEQQDGPANAGRKWTEEEETELRKGFEAGKKYKQLAKDHERTPGAIKARLIKLGLIEDPRAQSAEDS